ncbi:MAG: 1-acyl-sn-glycerol-3-phosphate acyltransferase [Clostridiales bacterium]|jgi:1-acyl-sn-glycerol-3-phosphate acyltransferase|nr:1-acyl-sn-glycerol-3-phosphate acyltransferase [Clostridiales bacterium]
MIYYFLKYFIAPIYLLIWRPIVHGKKNLRFSGGAIVISNHASYIDPVLLAFVSKRTIRYMAKVELFQSKLSALFMKGLLAFPVNRSSADLKSIKQAAEILQGGKVFGIFPEGTRSVTGRVDDFERGTAFIAVHSMQPVIPVYMDSTSYGFFKRPRIYVGKALDTEAICSDISRSQGIRLMHDKMTEAVNDLERIALSENKPR